MKIKQIIDLRVNCKIIRWRLKLNVGPLNLNRGVPLETHTPTESHTDLHSHTPTESHTDENRHTDNWYSSERLLKAHIFKGQCFHLVKWGIAAKPTEWLVGKDIPNEIINEFHMTGCRRKTNTRYRGYE